MLVCERVMCCALCACLPSFQSTGGEVYRDFEFAFDAAQRKEFWTLYGPLGCRSRLPSPRWLSWCWWLGIDWIGS